ncbi:acyl-CoA N-acyltransferase [Xylaria nigripes]|nr:acyl-CoA N-acyltransferase [Xylaria nigripes]
MLSQHLTRTEPVSLDLRIGHAFTSEAAAIAKIGAEVFTSSFGHAVPPDDLAKYLASAYTEAAVQADLKDPSLRTLVARDASGKVLAFVQLVRAYSEPCVPGDTASNAELRRLYVDAAVHGNGTGSRLIAAAEAEARAEGFKHLWLAVWQHNIKAEKLYLRLGYERCGTCLFPTSGTIHTNWVLSKRL